MMYCDGRNEIWISYKIHLSIIHVLYSSAFGNRESPVSWTLVPSCEGVEGLKIPTAFCPCAGGSPLSLSSLCVTWDDGVLVNNHHMRAWKPLAQCLSPEGWPQKMLASLEELSPPSLRPVDPPECTFIIENHSLHSTEASGVRDSQLKIR